MKTTFTDDAIESACRSAWRALRATVSRQVVRGKLPDAGTWFVLAVDRGDGWQVVGRRRTKQELLKLAKRGPLVPRTRANAGAAI